VAVVSSPNGVRVEALIDIAKMWLAGLTTAGFVFAMIARMSSKRARRAMWFFAFRKRFYPVDNIAIG
jgi:hypothetical protein